MSDQPPNPGESAEIAAAFDGALDQPPGERAQWLARHYAHAPAILRQVTRLLSAEEGSRDMFAALEGQRAALLGDMLGDGHAGSANADPRTGRLYGPWKIIRHIGSGGLAEVYEVQRDDGRYEQRGALKILRAGILGQHARELFLRERRLLANLDHPGIVRIIDGGETSTGSPWLVMELADGLPIDAYCRAQALEPEARLLLLAAAADIMSAAHARLVIHGDLKADHLLVGEDGQLRVLDFGIAQALDEQGLGRSAEGFSPAYASPEQAAGQALSTASDIFQLGQIAAQVMEGFALSPGVAAIIARATATDPTGRYPSMAGLAADLRAVVADQPLAALPDTRIAALRRLARHNRLAAGLAALLLVGSAGWAITATLSAQAIERERIAALAAADREERGKSVLLDLFRRADLLEADSLGLDPAAAAAMLDETLASARETLADDPLLLADLVNWTARAHLRASESDTALALAAEEVALLDAANAGDTLRAGAAHAFHAHVLASAGETDAASAEADRALALLGDQPPAERLAVDLLVSVAWSKEGDWTAQRDLFTRALGVLETVDAPMAEIEVRSGLGRALVGLGDLDAARPQVERAVELVRQMHGERHPRLALPLSDMGRLEEHAGNPQAAIALHRQALAISEAAFGPSHSSTLAHRNNLALALTAAGDTDAAIAEYERLLAAQTDPLARGEVAQNLAAALVQAGRYARADTVLALAERAFAGHLPAGHPRRVFPALTRSEMRLAQHRWREAEADARTALATLEQALPAGHYAIETALCRIGMALLGAGDRAQARTYLLPAAAALEADENAPARLVEPCRGAVSQL